MKSQNTKRRNKLCKRITIAIVVIVLGAMTMQSCAVLGDPDFQEGFRQGWNSTCPPGYEY